MFMFPITYPQNLKANIKSTTKRITPTIIVVDFNILLIIIDNTGRTKTLSVFPCMCMYMYKYNLDNTMNRCVLSKILILE